jgi:8-oxo-dGTP pyrophosphatase MutT (NUDIX family)
MAMSPWLARVRSLVGNELLMLPSAAGVLFDAQDRMLVVRDLDSGNWVIPGGYLDPGETPRDCCERELREELGLEVRAVRLLGTFSGPEFRVRYSNGHEVQPVITCFECERTDPAAAIDTDGEEIGEHRWVAPAELEDLSLQPWAATTLPRLWSARQQPPLA